MRYVFRLIFECGCAPSEVQAYSLAFVCAFLRTGSTSWKTSVNLSAVEMGTKLTFRRAHDVSFHLELPTHEEFLRIRITRD